MARKRDDGSGQYTAAYSDESFLNAIEDIDGIATTPKIMDYLDCSQRTALDKLHALEDDQKIESQKVGNTYVWCVVDD